MVTFGKKVVKYRIPILILSVLLLVPSVLGMIRTRVNYDIMTYLPDDIETMQGQDILLNDFGKGAFSFIIVEGMDAKDISSLREKIAEVPHVADALWYDSLADISVPMEMLPNDVYDAFNSDDATMMAVFFDSSTSADETMDALTQIRSIATKQCYVTGMSAMVTDLKQLTEQEEPIYVGIAVLLSTAVMMIFMDSWILPFIFLASIGMAILWNLGSNYFLGEISFITKALSAVLQLAVTMDYSIFLWHSYEEQQNRFHGDKNRAMAHAIAHTVTSVVGSSVTTVAGFIALCFMTFTLGRDLGIVMAKGVIFGVIGCVTTLPALILAFDKLIEKLRHRSLIPDMTKPAKFITGHAWIFILLFVVILVPALYGYTKTNVYYDLGSTLPESLPYTQATAKLEEDFGTGATHMILASSELSSKDAKAMTKAIQKVDGVQYAIGYDSLIGSSIPEEMIPDDVKEILKSGKYQLMLVQSEYKTASDEVNNQITEINDILDQYDTSAMLIGEAPCTKDLITITDHDFSVVNVISIIAIFVIILLVLKSISLPVVLVAVIEFAIFINLGLPYYTNTTLPFIAPICISTIQLGATVDYAILMTTRYKRERSMGESKHDAITGALAYSIPSIIVSALGFFAATFGVGLYSNIDIISSLCDLMARGAIISLFSVVFVLPSFFMVFDKIICATSIGFKSKKEKAAAVPAEPSQI